VGRRFRCGLDPGREKFGLAICGGSELIFSAIIPVSSLDVTARCLKSGDFSEIAHLGIEGAPPRGAAAISVFLGNGTGFRLFKDELEERGVPCLVVDEAMTTLEGRALYWRLHPPRGLWRLLPLSLRVPPRAVDDMAAWAILMRASSEGR
jgi:hypothetical protein